MDVSELYPNASWWERQSKYEKWVRYFSGEVLDDVVEGTERLKYPVGLNIVRTLVLINAWAILGSWKDHVFSWDGPSSDVVQRLERISLFSGMDALYIRQVLTMLVYGECVWGVRRVVNGPSPFRFVVVPPDVFYPLYSSLDDQLLECFVRLTIPGREAELLGVSPRWETATYLEHWTRDGYEVSIDGEVIQSGPTPGRTIPYVTAPRPNLAGELYGVSLVQDVYRIQDEINARVSDVGDGVNQDTHRDTFLSNLPHGLPGIRRQGNLVDLGMGLGDVQPKVHAVETSNVADASLSVVRMNLDFARYAAMTPPVAFGEDEGSQRSGATLTVRMWPLIQSAHADRVFMARALSSLVGILGAWSEDDALTAMDYAPRFPPSLPRDEKAIVDEISVLRGADLLGDESAYEMLGLNRKDAEEWLGSLRRYRKEKESLSNVEKRRAVQRSVPDGSGAVA